MYLQTQSIELILDSFLLLSGMFSVRKSLKNVSLRKPQDYVGCKHLNQVIVFIFDILLFLYCYTLFLFV